MREVLSLLPGDGDILNRFGQLEMLARDLHRAERYFNEVLKLDPKNLDARFSMGLLRLKQFRFEHARRIFETLAAEHPQKDKDLVYFNLGLAELAQGEIAAAKSYFRQAYYLSNTKNTLAREFAEHDYSVYSKSEIQQIIINGALPS
ncbi:MAG: tetratricopeptide repeat protein, partial [Thermodesulfobacteriota bacterium]